MCKKNKSKLKKGVCLKCKLKNTRKFIDIIDRIKNKMLVKNLNSGAHYMNVCIQWMQIMKIYSYRSKHCITYITLVLFLKLFRYTAFNQAGLGYDPRSGLNQTLLRYNLFQGLKTAFKVAIKKKWVNQKLILIRTFC